MSMLKQRGIPMKNVFWTALIILGSFCVAEARVVDRIYAQVNEDIITLSDINRKMEGYRREYASRMSGEELEEALEGLKANILDTLIQEKLLVQKAIELGLDADVEPTVSSEIQRTMQEYNMETMEQFEDALENQGTNLRDFRELIRNQVMAVNIIEIFVRSRITLMTSEVEKYYKNHGTEYANPEEVALSEIIITASAEGSRDAAEKRAWDLYERSKKGESFSSLASRYSKGASANNGGSIGNNLLEKWHPDIVKAISGLESGDVTEPQPTNGGFVIYRVDDRVPSVVPPLEDIRDQIKQKMYDDKFQPELQRFVTRLKEEAYIQIYSETE
jgi:peptidyl-prolyl cis-trans isomerase SurA